MNYQPSQQPQWPQQPEQPQTGNPQTQGWSSQALNMPPMRQFQRPPFQSLPSIQPQQSQYEPPPVPNYAFTQQQPPYLKQQIQQAKTNQVKPGFFSKRVGVPMWALILVVGVIFTLSAVSIGNGSILKTRNTPSNTSSIGPTVSTSSIPTTLPTNTPTPIPTEIPSPTPLPILASKVGGTLIANGVSCTLISVKFLPDDGVTVPKTGDEFIIAHVKLINESGTDFDYLYVDFKARSGTGNVTDPEPVPPSTYTANDQINDSGTLSPDGTTVGDVTLEVPIGDHNAELVWQPTFFDSSTAYTWNLGL